MISTLIQWYRQVNSFRVASRASLVFVTALLSACQVKADAPLEGTKPAQWRVVWTDDPATKATIVWSTAEQGRSHSVRVSLKETGQAVSVQRADTGRYTGGPDELYYHTASLTKLRPSTKYEIQMISDGETSPVLFFQTAPAHDREFSILHGGDSRSDRDSRRRMNKKMASMLEASHANDDLADDILALAHGGDFIVSGSRVDQWSRWMSDHELTTTSKGRLLPVIPARGNHDRGKPFNQVFGFPEDDLNYYAINISSQVRFVTLNSETSTAGDQATWLENELKSTRSENRWLVAQYHRPAYPAVKSPGSGLQSWVPLFEKYNIDLVCESDGHNIKRTVPIRNGKQDPTGIVYIGEGGLGVSQRTPKTDRWYLKSPGMADKGNHVFLLTFGREELHGKCVLENGTIRDEFRLKVRSVE